jgi:hypothetical protein
MKRWVLVVSGAACVMGVGAVRADEIEVDAKRLLVISKPSSGKVTFSYLAKDTTAGITKGPGTDPDAIGVELRVTYFLMNGDSATGAFVIPPGAHDGEDGWKLNNESVAKYVNPGAPGGPTGAKTALIKPGTLLRLVGKSLGDSPLDLSLGDDLAFAITEFEVVNDGDSNTHCTLYLPDDIALTSLAGGTVRKLKGKGGKGECPKSEPCKCTFQCKNFAGNVAAGVSVANSTQCQLAAAAVCGQGQVRANPAPACEPGGGGSVKCNCTFQCSGDANPTGPNEVGCFFCSPEPSNSTCVKTAVSTCGAGLIKSMSCPEVP